MGIDAVKMHDELLAAQPEGARHEADICPFCIARVAAASSSLESASIPSGAEPLDAPIPNDSPEGGTTTAMSDNTDMISRETHEALLEKALRDATAATDEALSHKLEELAALNGQIETLASEKANLVSENERLSSELDSAQAGLKAATDEVASMKADIAAQETEAAKAELASQRVEQVKALGLFPEAYITERASKWADLPAEDWAERVEEWRNLPASTSQTTDTASAMSGASNALTDEPVEEASSKPVPARRAVLGLK